MTPQHHLPADIERTSMAIITEELQARGADIPPENAAVVKRVIHTTADFDYAENLQFTPGAAAAGVAAMHAGATIITDTNMALAGITKPGLARLGGRALCFMAEPAVAEAARAAGTTRAVAAMHQNGLGCVLKHFPGYGNNADTHTGIARDDRPLETLENADLVPFAAGMQAGCDAILVSHILVSALDETAPASLSPAVHDYLRNTMGFDGVIVTDDLVMEAITQVYGVGEAAVQAVLAGNDLLCSTEYPVQYAAVLEAVQRDQIPEDLINDAVLRILHWKQDLGFFN